MILDSYLGFPNFGKVLISSNIENDVVSKLSGLAPSGFRFEYMVKDNLGVGVDAIFNNIHATYKQFDTISLDQTETVTITTIDAIMKRTRIQFRLNYHLDGVNPHFDSYLGFGLGTNRRTFRATKNGVNNATEFEETLGLISVPFSMRVCVGSRYYISRNIGIVGEFGFGGPLISLGLSLKY
jgi:hypothetical protein